MPNLDRFAQGAPDPAEAPVLATCEACGGEIYPGESVYVADGNVFHCDAGCLISYLLENGWLGEMSIEEALR